MSLKPTTKGSAGGTPHKREQSKANKHLLLCALHYLEMDLLME